MAVHLDSEGKLSIWGLIDQSLDFSTYLVKESDTGVEMPGIFQASIIGVGEIADFATLIWPHFDHYIWPPP